MAGCCPVGSVIVLEPFLLQFVMGRERAAKSNCLSVSEDSNVVKVTLCLHMRVHTVAWPGLRSAIADSVCVCVVCRAGSRR